MCVFARCAALALQRRSADSRGCVSGEQRTGSRVCQVADGLLNGEALHDTDPRHAARDAAFLLLFNAHHEPLDFTLPPASFGESWSIVLDTATEVGEREGRFTLGSALAVRKDRSVIVLSRL